MEILYTLKNSDFKVVEYIDLYGNIVRALKSDKAIYSLTLIGKYKYSISDPYFGLYDFPVQLKPNTTNFLMLGAGCFTYPKYYISKYKEKYMDAVEIDKEIIDITHKYFFLNDLYEEHDPEKKRLKIFNEDALTYIENNKKKYDVIFIDIFNDNEPIDKFLTNEFFEKIKNSLTSDGIFSNNYIITEGHEDKFKNYLNVLKNKFKYIYILTLKGYFKEEHGNIYIMCTDYDYKLEINDARVEILDESIFK